MGTKKGQVRKTARRAYDYKYAASRGTSKEWGKSATGKKPKLAMFRILQRPGGPGIRSSFKKNLRMSYGLKGGK